MSSNLIAHNPRFAAQLVSRQQLQALPLPSVLGPWHKPIAHIELIDAVVAEAVSRGLTPTKEQYALGSKTCETCGICDGTQGRPRRTSVYILEHGPMSQAKHRRALVTQPDRSLRAVKPSAMVVL